MNARTDPSLLSKEATRRINERKAWALRQREEGEKRIATVKAELEREKREKQEALERMAREAAMVTELLQEMYQLNPEFAARRQAVLQVSPSGLISERAINRYRLCLAQSRARAPQASQTGQSTTSHHFVGNV